MKNKNLLFLDTETTGFGPESGIVQVAYSKGTKKIHEQLFRPKDGVVFQPSASETNHITAKTVKKEMLFEVSQMYEDISEMVANEETIFVAHNAQFDINALANEDIKFNCRVIDTQKIALKLLNVSHHRLQYLRYRLELDVDAKAHDAAGDVKVLMALFDYLVQEVKERDPNMTDEQIINWLASNSI